MTVRSPHDCVDLITSARMRMPFARARFGEPSPALEQVPFLFWLAECALPCRHVTLSVGDGVAYFALCQAIATLVPDGRCTGILSGDLDADAALRAHNHRHYDRISALLRDDPDEVGDGIADGTLDLLCVEGQADEALLERWGPKLSDRAVILLHGADVVAPRHEIPSIYLDGGGGLRVLLYGADCDARLRQLAHACEDGRMPADTGHLFDELGRTHRDACATDRATRDLAKVATALSATQRDLTDRNRQVAALEDTIEIQDRAYDLRSRIAADAQARAFDLQMLETELRAERDAMARDLADVTARLVERTDTVDRRDRDIARLTARASELDAARADIARLRASLSDRFMELARALHHIDGLRARITHLSNVEDHVQALLASSSWKLTAPVRWLSRRLNR